MNGRRSQASERRANTGAIVPTDRPTALPPYRLTLSHARRRHLRDRPAARSVLVHTPGPELEAVTPGNREDYLYDDIIDLEIAQREHRQFVSVLRRFAPGATRCAICSPRSWQQPDGARVPHHQDDGRGPVGRAGAAARHAAAGADRRDADRGHPGGERPAGRGRSTRWASPFRRCRTSSSPATSAW